ncbi:MAG: S-layer homology domain-containing protein [Cyanobacteriota bacterium]|nr:S-layer homology domain-containing protein [Cyanobacteriota bacterium]
MTFAKATLSILVALSPMIMSAAATKATNTSVGVGAASKVSKIAQESCQVESAEDGAAKNANACVCYRESTAPPEIPPLEAARQTDPFSDLDGHWAKYYIEALADEGIISGRKDGTFKPEDPITWNDLATLLEKSFPGSCAHQLTDLGEMPASHWARKALNQSPANAKLKASKAEAQPEFDPNLPMSRVQLVVALVEGMNLAATSDMQDAASTSFRDAANIPDYAKESVDIALANHLVTPDPERPWLFPDHDATRADVAALIYKGLVSSGAMYPVAEDIDAANTEGQALVPLSFEDKIDLFATSNTPGSIAIGMAEGTRTVDGRPTANYAGHRDPGNGKWNLGTFSYQHGAPNPQEADMLQLQRLYPHVVALEQTAEAYGIELSVMELVAGVDLANQAPLATPHYIGWLQRAYNSGYTGLEAILEARSYSFINPDTGRLEAGGFRNNWQTLRRDQARRLAAMYYTLQAHGIISEPETENVE